MVSLPGTLCFLTRNMAHSVPEVKTLNSEVAWATSSRPADKSALSGSPSMCFFHTETWWCERSLCGQRKHANQWQSPGFHSVSGCDVQQSRRCSQERTLEWFVSTTFTDPQTLLSLGGCPNKDYTQTHFSVRNMRIIVKVFKWILVRMFHCQRHLLKIATRTNTNSRHLNMDLAWSGRQSH